MIVVHTVQGRYLEDHSTVFVLLENDFNNILSSISTINSLGFEGSWTPNQSILYLKD